jgi:hypothetical protein
MYRKLRIIRFLEIFEFTNSLSRLIPPLGFRVKIPTLIEERVMQLPHIYVPSGKSEVTWKLNPNDLVLLFANLGIPCSIAPLLGPYATTFITKLPFESTDNVDNENNTT